MLEKLKLQMAKFLHKWSKNLVKLVLPTIQNSLVTSLVEATTVVQILARLLIRNLFKYCVIKLESTYNWVQQQIDKRRNRRKSRKLDHSRLFYGSILGFCDEIVQGPDDTDCNLQHKDEYLT